jgi:hypothetical protein
MDRKALFSELQRHLPRALKGKKLDSVLDKKGFFTDGFIQELYAPVHAQVLISGIAAGETRLDEFRRSRIDMVARTPGGIAPARQAIAHQIGLLDHNRFGKYILQNLWMPVTGHLNLQSGEEVFTSRLIRRTERELAFNEQLEGLAAMPAASITPDFDSTDNRAHFHNMVYLASASINAGQHSLFKDNGTFDTVIAHPLLFALKAYQPAIGKQGAALLGKIASAARLRGLVKGNPDLFNLAAPAAPQEVAAFRAFRMQLVLTATGQTSANAEQIGFLDAFLTAAARVGARDDFLLFSRNCLSKALHEERAQQDASLRAAVKVASFDTRLAPFAGVLDCDTNGLPQFFRNLPAVYSAATTMARAPGPFQGGLNNLLLIRYNLPELGLPPVGTEAAPSVRQARKLVN